MSRGGLDRGFWWFSNSRAGRFDLPAPDGTCYLANDPEICAREYLRHHAVKGRVAAALLEGREVAQVVIDPAPVLADLTSGAANRMKGMSREIFTTTDYDKTQAWAIYLADKGFEGIAYQPRHTMDAGDRSYALFGRNESGYPVPFDVRPLIDVVVEAGIEVIHPPRSNTLTYKDPPV